MRDRERYLADILTEIEIERQKTGRQKTGRQKDDMPKRLFLRSCALYTLAKEEKWVIYVESVMTQGQIWPQRTTKLLNIVLKLIPMLIYFF